MLIKPPDLAVEPVMSVNRRDRPQVGASVADTPVAQLPALRILMITESFLPQVNGVTNSVRWAASFLSAHGHTVRIVAPTRPEGYIDAEVTTVAGLDFPTYRQFRLGVPAPRSLKRIAEEFAPDVVHVASPFGYGGAALRVLRHFPTVAVYQTDIVGWAEKYGLRALASWCRIRTARIHRNASLTLVPSQESRSAFESYGISAVGLWGRGVDLELFHPRRYSEALHQKLRGDARLLVGYVGRLSREKELEQLTAMADIAEVQLIIVGDGPLRSRLQEDLPTALFLGTRHGAELADLYATFDIFINPCTTETFCQAAQEALASGTPVIGPSAGGMRDRIRHRQTGLYFEPGEALALRHAVMEVVTDGVLRNRLGENARRKSDLRSWDALGMELLEHYRDVLQKGRVRRQGKAPTWTL